MFSEARVTDEGFRKLAAAELGAVYRLACHLLRDSQQAEDCVQETYLRAYRGAASFALGTHGIRPWLFKILHNVIYTHGARDSRERLAMDTLREIKRGELSDDGTAAVDCSSLDWDAVDQRLKAAIDALQMPYREAFLLSAVEGLKYEEIAEVTQAPVGTVMSRLSRARSILAQRLVDLANEEGFKKPQASDATAAKSDEKREDLEAENV